MCRVNGGGGGRHRMTRRLTTEGLLDIKICFIFDERGGGGVGRQGSRHREAGFGKRKKFSLEKKVIEGFEGNSLWGLKARHTGNQEYRVTIQKN